MQPSTVSRTQHAVKGAGSHTAGNPSQGQASHPQLMLLPSRHTPRALLLSARLALSLAQGGDSCTATLCDGRGLCFALCDLLGLSLGLGGCGLGLCGEDLRWHLEAYIEGEGG